MVSFIIYFMFIFSSVCVVFCFFFQTKLMTFYVASSVAQREEYIVPTHSNITLIFVHIIDI